LSRLMRLWITLLMAGGLAACAADHSPDIYASNAVQQANKVEPGIVIGYREVRISANGTAGAVTGGAAGGVLGSQLGSSNFDHAMGSVAGSAIGGVLGVTLEHVTGDSTGWEYIVRKPNGDLISVTLFHRSTGRKTDRERRRRSAENGASPDLRRGADRREADCQRSAAAQPDPR